MNAIIKKNGISFGIGMGIFSVLVTTVMYTMAMEMFASIWLGLALLAIYLVVDCILLSKTKKEMAGVMSFKEGFTTYFIAAVISAAISTIYNMVLFNFVDPSAKEKIKEVSIKASVDMLQKFNAPAAQINQTIEKLQQQDNFSFASLAFGFFITLCVSCVIGLILAAIFKSRPTYQD